MRVYVSGVRKSFCDPPLILACPGVGSDYRLHFTDMEMELPSGRLTSPSHTVGNGSYRNPHLLTPGPPVFR